MPRNKKLAAALAVIFLLNIALIAGFQWLGISSQAAVYQQGSQGETVRQIQEKLKRWGYYDGAVDGVYGSGTRKAVEYFQRKNGLTVDGIVGPATLQALGMSSGSSSGSESGRDNDLYLLSRMISAEARGEPNPIAGVIYQPGAFSALNDGQFDEPIAESARRAAQDAMSGWDPTGGAIYYYNPQKTTNQWIYSRPVIAQIGDHVFAK